MVIASARGAEIRGSARMKIRSSGSGQNAEGFERDGDGLAVEAVIAMLALSQDFYKMFGGEAMQMGAGGGRAHTSEGGELGAGAGAIVHQGEQDARTSWFADSRGDFGDGKVVTGRWNANTYRRCNHSSMINEV